jgi:hypothetical protein
MIEIFKTNVDTSIAPELLTQLQHHFPSCKINFDLDDCDRILRIEGHEFCKTTIIKLISSSNCMCKVLEE